MTSELLPCPFCGSDRVLTPTMGSLTWASCAGCSCDGPAEDGRRQAITAWNTRTREKMLVEALEKSDAAQANLVRMAERERESARHVREAFDLVAPFVAKFAGAVAHYNRTPPRYPGSTFNQDPDPGYTPALGVSIHGQVPLNGPTIGDLRMLADAYELALAALSQQTAEA